MDWLQKNINHFWNDFINININISINSHFDTFKIRNLKIEDLNLGAHAKPILMQTTFILLCT